MRTNAIPNQYYAEDFNQNDFVLATYACVMFILFVYIYISSFYGMKTSTNSLRLNQYDKYYNLENVGYFIGKWK